MHLKSHKVYELIIIGGGASALMAGYHLKDCDFLMIEANEKLGKKLLVCGGGFVNVTNRSISAQNYLGEKDFVASVLEQFGSTDLMGFLTANSIAVELRSNGCYFCKDRSSYLVGFFARNINPAKIRLGSKVVYLSKRADLFEVATDKEIYICKKVLIATGSPAYPVLGATSCALDFAGAFGHKVLSFAPALVGFTLQKDQFWMKELSGVSLPVRLMLNGKTIVGNLLFAHKGISGPAVLNASLWWSSGKITIDFLPNVDIKNQIRSNPQKTPISAFNLPKSFTRLFFEHIGVEMKPLGKYSKNELDLITTIKNYTFAPAGTFGLTKCEACRGGVEVCEIDPMTMQSRRVEGLYFAGEALNVTGEVGGYNLQWAFATAFIAARAIRSNNS